MAIFPYCYGTITDKGDVRAENQDSLLAEAGSVHGHPAALMVVADGMGGLAYGAQISAYITEQFDWWWREDFPSIVGDGIDRDEDIQELLEQEIWDINRGIFEFRSRMRCRAGSTLSLLLLYNGKYYVENLGDSRIYLYRDGMLFQLTKDQAVESKGKRMLTMCMGMFEVPESQYLQGNMRPGDGFLLCSDGLYSALDEGRMEEIMGICDITAQEKAEYLRQEIAFGNARDNVSVIVLEIGGKG